MSKYQPYPQYKDSGVEWLGEVPEHWEVKRLKYFTTVNDETLSEKYDEDFEINYIDIGSVTTGYIQNSEVILYSDAPSRARRIVREGDILVSTVRTYLKAIAPVSHSENGYIASTGFAVIRSRNDVCSDYLKYALLSNYFINLVESESTGISYPAINASELVTFNIALAPFEEQQVVANFLDNATCKIDTLIQKQQNLIELLKEKRQALISHTVTKGLNPHVKMKDSGVEWLGEIPEHWGVVQSRRLFKDRKEKARNDDEQLTASQKYGVIYQKEFMELEGRKVTLVLTGSEILKHVEAGDFVISMRSFQGGLELCKYSGSVSSAYIGLIPIKHVIHDYFKYLFKSITYIQALQSTSNLVRDGQALRFENFSQVDLVIVPEIEQQQIANYLDNATCKIDTLISKAQEAIELLKERRTALISATVTGKIDVREITE